MYQYDAVALSKLHTKRLVCGLNLETVNNLFFSLHLAERTIDPTSF